MDLCSVLHFHHLRNGGNDDDDILMTIVTIMSGGGGDSVSGIIKDGIHDGYNGALLVWS